MRYRTRTYYTDPEGIDVGALDGGLDSSSDWPSVCSTSHFCPDRLVEDRRHSTTGTATQRRVRFLCLRTQCSLWSACRC